MGSKWIKGGKAAWGAIKGVLPDTKFKGQKTVKQHKLDVSHKKNIDKIRDWKNVFDLIPKKFKNSEKLKKTGISGIFAATLELTREGIITIMQKKNFDKLLIKEKK